jgi:hypothetical protein
MSRKLITICPERCALGNCKRQTALEEGSRRRVSERNASKAQEVPRNSFRAVDRRSEAKIPAFKRPAVLIPAYQWLASRKYSRNGATRPPELAKAIDKAGLASAENPIRMRVGSVCF